MDVTWIIFDSVSYSATSFDSDGPETTPQLKRLAENNARIYTKCYTPGPASPSSHGSFFTGHHPSQTGMHGLNPYYNENYPTIADAVKDTHQSFLISTNQFLHQGLEEGFDEVTDLKRRDRVPFPEASHPYSFDSDKNGMNKYKDFVFAEGKPIRSFLNGIWWKTTAEKVPSAASGVIEETNNEIREFRQKNTTKTLVVANYMEAHAPFDPPTDAIRQFTNKPVSQLPVGESGTKIRKKYNTKPDFGASDMYALYKASIWDLDRKVSPLIKEMISDDTFVIVTADHGNWFRLDDYLDEDRIHVPLLIFGPDTQGRYIDNTVNLRHIAATTTATLSEQGYNVNQLPGENILEATDNLISITDFLFRDVIDELETHPVSVHKQENGEWYHHVTAIKGDAKINYNGGSDKLEEIRGSESNLEELRESLSKHVERPVTFDDNQRMQMDEQTKDRLRKLGYIN